MQERAPLVFVALVLLVIPLGLFAQTTITDNTTVTGLASVVGAISKGSGTFVIDHPLDPKNKLLYHSFVESNEVKNLYDGVVVLDENGEATIELPEYFLRLNTDYRYLASGLSSAMPTLYIKKEIGRKYGVLQRATFTIAGGEPGGEVSWQITGNRRDLLIQKHPFQDEVKKSPDELVDEGECIFAPLCE